jgi:hypothetical protein
LQRTWHRYVLRTKMAYEILFRLSYWPQQITSTRYGSREMPRPTFLISVVSEVPVKFLVGSQSRFECVYKNLVPHGYNIKKMCPTNIVF